MKENVNAETKKRKKILGAVLAQGELDQDKRCRHTELGVLAVGPGSAIGVSHLYGTDNNKINGIREQTYWTPPGCRAVLLTLLEITVHIVSLPSLNRVQLFRHSHSKGKRLTLA